MFHKSIQPSDNHIVYAWAVADATARGALSVVAADIGKLCWQQNNDSFWILKSVGPATWATPEAQAHNHDGVYEPADASILKDADVGVSVAAQGHNHDAAYLAVALKGASSGLAELDAGGKVPAAQLPSYVDDVLEYANLAAFPGTGVTGVIYVAIDSNYTYRWSGSAYIQISGGAGGSTTLDGLTDVVITTAANGQVLKYNGSEWVNAADSTGGTGGSESFHPFLMMGA